MPNGADFDQSILNSLEQRGLLTGQQVATVRTQIQANGRSVDETLLSLGLVEEDHLLRLIGDIAGLPIFGEIDETRINRGLFDQFGAAFWDSRSMLPLRHQDAELILVTATPGRHEAVNETLFLLDESATLGLAQQHVLRKATRKIQNTEKSKSEEKQSSGGSHASLPSLNTTADGIVAQEVDRLVADAVSLGASDIHLNAHGAKLTVRFRIDGALRSHRLMRDIDAQAVFARLKLMAGMSVTERRLPQDGSCRVNHAGRAIELRVSTLPAQSGETMVCRVLDPQTARGGWQELGFPKPTAEALIHLVEQPFGLLIISGPTGSGKTTTLYTALRHLSDGSRKILTVEDPVEQTIEGVEQVQINPALGLGFGDVLRTALRHDPDVLMVGEIRDEETAEIACRAALIGRLVLATIHASSTKLVRERFINLGVPAYLVDEVLIGVLSQRLIAQNCSKCHGTGCPACDGQGTGGRKPDVHLWQPEVTG